jgi:hypothetical protein
MNQSSNIVSTGIDNCAATRYGRYGAATTRSESICICIIIDIGNLEIQ